MIIVGPPAVVGRGSYELGTIRLSFCPAVFLGLAHQFCSEIQHGVGG